MGRKMHIASMTRKSKEEQTGLQFRVVVLLLVGTCMIVVRGINKTQTSDGHGMYGESSSRVLPKRRPEPA